MSALLAVTACAGSVAPGASSASSTSASAAQSASASAAAGTPTEGTPVSTAPALDAKAACQAFNAGFVEYREGLTEAASKNWLLLGAKMIDQGGRSPAEVAGPLNALSDLAYARADAGGETAPSDKEKAVTTAVVKAMGACTAAGVTLEL